MSEIRIGKVGRRVFRIAVRIASEAVAVFGVRGTGKTITAKVIAEGLLEERRPIVVIDPTDVWHGLRSSADGKKPGYPVLVLGGANGDFPIDEHSGAAIADLVVDNRVSVVVSTRHLRKGKQRILVQEFAEQLYHRKGEAGNRVPVTVFIDEASAFVPQRVDASSARMVGAIEDLVRRGRSAGIGVVLIDQRPASVNKDVLTQVSTLVCHRVSSPQDNKALDDWIALHDSKGQRKEFRDTLPALDVGEAWFWSPALDLFASVSVQMISTFDSSKTPEFGEDAAAPLAIAEIDVEALGDALEVATESARANDPKVLRERIEAQRKEHETAIAELRAVHARELREARSATDLDAYMADVTGKAMRVQAHVGPDVAKSSRARILAAIEEIVGVADDVEERMTSAHDVADELAHLAPGIPARPEVVRTPPARTYDPPPDLPDSIGGAHLKILGAIAQLESLGIPEPKNAQIGMLSGYSAKGGTFSTYMSRLSGSGYIERGRGCASLTDAGRDLAPPVPQFTTRAELHAYWLSQCPGEPHRKMLTALIGVYPDDMSNGDLGEVTGYASSGGTFSTYLSRLSGMGLVKRSRGRARASDLLFPENL